MGLYRSPGVYFTENIQSLGSTAFGYNRTAIIGLGQTYTTVSNLEIVKSNTITPKNEILMENVTPYLSEGELTENSYVIWQKNEEVEEGKIELPEVKAHWIGRAIPSVGDFVILVDTEEKFGYKESVEGVEGALQVSETIEGNGFVLSTEEQSGSMKVVLSIENFDNILLPNGSIATEGEINDVLGIGNIPGFYNYTLGTDFTISEDKTKVIWIGKTPASGSVFYITYKLNKSEAKGDFNPVLMFNQTAIKQQFGPEFKNGVIQPLTLAADLVLEGQTLLGGGVYCCQVTEDTEAAYKAAIDKFDNINVQTIIILKQDSISLRNYLLEKIAVCSSSMFGKERTTFIIPNADLSTDAIVAQREALANDRVTYFANKTVTVSLTDDSTQETTEVELPAIYACCNLSGIEGNPDYGYSEPMLRKKLSSRITLVGDQVFDPSERNYLCSNYLSAFDFNENSYTTFVFDIFTTDSENVITETRQVRRVTDLLRTDLRKQLAVYIGQKNTQSTASSSQLKTQSILRNYVQAEEIKDFRNVSASYDPTNPKQLNISFTYLPLFEIKWVQVTLNINVD